MTVSRRRRNRLFHGELGIHFYLHKWGNALSAKEILKVGELVEQKLSPYGVNQVWVNDNLGYRSTLVTLAGLATRIKLKLGTAILVSYARSPIEVASAAATIAELMDGREFSLGIGPGSRVLLEEKMEVVKPARFFRETVRIIRGLIKGETLDLSKTPLVSRYFGLKGTWGARLKFTAGGNIKIFGAVHQGRETLIREMVSRLCDGMILGRVRSTLTDADLNSDVEAIDSIRKEAGLSTPFRRAIQMTTSIGRDGAAAKKLVKGGISHFLDRVGAPAKFGFSEEQAVRIRELVKLKGEDSLGDLIPDEAVNKFYIAGTPGECVERVAGFLDLAERCHFNQVVISGPLGPDLMESLQIWEKDILPSVMR
jgi:5,10-methylenetetrahydromethanopterin reductase